MNPVSAIVVYAVLWFLTCLVWLPVGLRTQGDVGEIVPGTHAGAPANFRVGRMMLIVTLISAVLWAIVVGTIVYSGLTIKDLDFFGRMN